MGVTMSKPMEVGSLWPGIIEVYPQRELKFQAVYRDKSYTCPSYRDAEDWIRKQQEADKYYVTGR